MIVVADATPLIALAKIEQITLLRCLFNEICIPQAVYAEVVLAAPERTGADEVRQADWIRIVTICDPTKVRYLRVELDAGEAEALVLAEELQANWIVLDESKARRVAEILGLPYIGTVGLLLLAKQRGCISQLRPLLDALRAQRFRLSDRVYQAVLRQANEDEAL